MLRALWEPQIGIAYLMHTLCPCQPPKYTLSCKESYTPEGVPGIGWADDGIKKYNELQDLVEGDRTSNGVSFNQALLSVYMERRRIATNKLPRGIVLQKQRTVPRDDLGGDQEPLFEDCVYEQQSSV